MSREASFKKIGMVLICFLLFDTVFAQPGEVVGLNAFAKMKTLAGEWEGQTVHDGHVLPTTTTFKAVADDSVVLDDLAPGTQHEMVTMFHMDGTRLLATHYCSNHNQPRLVAVSGSDPNVIEFEFLDATNLPDAAARHMTHIKFIVVDSEHHIEEWTAMEKGQPITLRFEFHRKKV